MKIIKWVNNAYHWLMPFYCSLCQNPSTSHPLCKPCYQELPWLQNACPICANQLSLGSQELAICGTCLQKLPPYDNTFALFTYQFPITKLILAMKFHRKLSYARLFGDILAKQALQYYQGRSKPDFIIPMPLHRQRLITRGYNQALELAKPLAKKLNIPYSNHLCSRIVDTLTQSSMNASRRRQNVKYAFTAEASVTNKYLIVVDDVITTGSTVTELCQQLRTAGAAKIDIWCCARTSLKHY